MAQDSILAVAVSASQQTRQRAEAPKARNAIAWANGAQVELLFEMISAEGAE